MAEGDSTDAATLATRLHTSAVRDFQVRGQQIAIGLSIGGAIYPRDGTDATTLMANADAALYRAKADGRGLMAFFDPEMDRELRQRLTLQHDLRAAVSHDQLLLHYQPQARIEGEVFGFEALCRWQHPEQGLVPPNTFIPLAEQNGTIAEIGEWTLRRGLPRGRIVEEPAPDCGQPLAGAVPLRRPRKSRPFDPLETGLKPSRLELEITEGVLIRDPNKALAILRRLKALGVRIAMDDFGTGYASLASLQSFPFDKIKIDRSFVSGISSNMQSAAIVRTVLGLGIALDIPVIAEGVETEEERQFLRDEGCEEMQGYLVGRPQPIASYDMFTDASIPAAAPRKRRVAAPRQKKLA